MGDQVLATDPVTGATEPKAVVATIASWGSKNLVEITISSKAVPPASDATASATPTTAERGDKLIATDVHPFWIANLNRWVNAGDLQVGQWLRTAAGTWVQITALKRWTVPNQRVYNLTVADLHTYYVIAGNTPVLVHNVCGEVVLPKFDHFEQARNEALNLLGDIDPATRVPLVGRLEKATSTYGKTVGFTTRVNGVYKEFRMDYDPVKGPHINVMVGKGSSAQKWAVPWQGSESDLINLLGRNS